MTVDVFIDNYAVIVPLDRLPCGKSKDTTRCLVLYCDGSLTVSYVSNFMFGTVYRSLCDERFVQGRVSLPRSVLSTDGSVSRRYR